MSKKGHTENWTRIIGFKVQCANHYTIRPSVIKMNSPSFYSFQIKKGNSLKDFIKQIAIIIGAFTINYSSWTAETPPSPASFPSFGGNFNYYAWFFHFYRVSSWENRWPCSWKSPSQTEFDHSYLLSSDFSKHSWQVCRYGLEQPEYSWC